MATVVFFLIQSTLSALIDLPFSLYSNFVVEERHGFNKYTLKFFIWDSLKKFLFFQPIIGMFIAASTFIIIKYEDQFFIYLWIFATSMSIIFMVIYPSFIAPLFDKYTPLPEGSLRIKIQQLADKLNFPLKNIFVVDGSKRSAHSNAYFFGMFKTKQIVLYDTLFEKTEAEKTKKEADDAKDSDSTEDEQPPAEAVKAEEPKKKTTGCTESEIIAIICHELGHWYYSHLYKNLLISMANMFLIFQLASLFYNDDVIYQAFGFVGPHKPRFIGLMLVIENIFLIYFEVSNQRRL